MSHETFVAPSLANLAELLPSYQLEAFIAQGGMGAVYKARQRSLDRDVAIKILPREFGADPEFRESFETEAKAMARLNHPNLIGVYDFGDVDGMPYIVMEMVNGKSLYHSCWNQQIEPVQSVSIVKGICEGLAHAHDNGVVHSDIKPANILLNAAAIPKIGDFGLARPVGTDGPAVIMGTPGYTAPEVTQSPDKVDKRIDIFSVGVILYELLAGSPPPAEGPLPSGPVSGNPPLDAIWRKAAHINPGLRFQSAGEMIEALDHWLANKGASRATSTLRTPAGSVVRPLATPAASSTGSVPHSPSLSAPRADPSSSHLGRNIALIIFLTAAIGVTYKLLMARTAERTAANQSIQTSSKPEPKKPDPAPPKPSGAVTRSPLDSIERMEPEPESARESLARLQSALQGGQRDELPIGAVSHKQSSFLYLDEEMTWLEAAAFAEKHGAQLAVVTDESDISVLMKMIRDNESAWIGAGVAGSGKWSRSDGRGWQLEKLPSGVGTYAAMQSFGAIRAKNANDRFGLLLEWQMDGSNPGSWQRMITATRPTLATDTPIYPPGTLSWDRSHYLAVLREVTRTEAMKLARQAGGYLATLSTKTEAEWIHDALKELDSTDGLWISGTRNDPVWVWDNGESWEAADWVSGYPTADGGSHLAFHPGQGWKNTNDSDRLAGFIIEWSASDEIENPGTPEAGEPGRNYTEIDDLDEKAAELVSKAEADRTKELVKNYKAFDWDLKKWTRSLNATDESRWTPEVGLLQNAIVNHRFPDPEIQFADVEEKRKAAAEAAAAAEEAARFNSFFENSTPKIRVQEVYPQKLIDLVNTAWLKQLKIDAEFNKAATVIRDSYVSRLATAADQARKTGQKELSAAIESKAGLAGHLEAWVKSFSNSAEAIPSGPAKNDTPGPVFDQNKMAGRWLWNNNQRVVWDLNPEGTCTCKTWGIKGRWSTEGNRLLLTWRNPDTISFEGDEKQLTGVNLKGDRILLTKIE